MLKKKQICKNCGKEVSFKAEICPNCGARIKQNPIVKIFVILICIFAVAVLGYIIVYKVRNYILDSIQYSYVGKWKLQTSEKEVSYDALNDSTGEEETDKYTIIIDDELDILKENTGYNLGNKKYCKDSFGNKIYSERCEEAYPNVSLNTKDKVVAINFITTEGKGVLLCFERKDDEIQQIKCGTSNSDKYNIEGLYTINGGINEQFNIIYKKVN